MAEIGHWSLIVTLTVSVYGAVASLVAKRGERVAFLESARAGAVVAAVGATLATAALLCLLVTRDFGIRYIYEHTSTHQAMLYSVSALWAGQQGSLLLWLWLASLLSLVITRERAVERASAQSYVLAVLAGTQAFLALTLVAASNPFERLPLTMAQGRGMNPLLESPWMVVHPPVVFAGYALYGVPFALTLAGLITGNLGREWVRAARRWSLLAWLFLGVGILLGAWWSYLELGWGGYWGWDPVENSSLLPWLSGTALLHSLLIQERDGRVRTWNLVLIVLTFVLCIFATFLTRSGFVQSVHAFARSPVGYYFLGFMAVTVASFGCLMYRRWRESGVPQDPPHPLSRRASVPLASLLFLGAAFVILVGTLFPTISGALLGRQAAVGPSFYEQAVGPLAQIILVLMGVCPWLTWRGTSFARLRRELLPPFAGAAATVALLHALGIRSAIALLSFGVCSFAAVSILALLLRDLRARRKRTGERVAAASVHLVRKNRRRYGAYTVHLAVVLIAMGVAGSSAYQVEALVARVPGERIEIRDYVLEYRDDLTHKTPVRHEFTALVDVYRNGRRLDTLRPQRNYYWGSEQWLTEVAVHTSLREDLYVSVVALEQDGLATFQVLINPLVVWLWIGGGVLLLGGLAAWWPSAARRTNR